MPAAGWRGARHPRQRGPAIRVRARRQVPHARPRAGAPRLAGLVAETGACSRTSPSWLARRACRSWSARRAPRPNLARGRRPRPGRRPERRGHPGDDGRWGRWPHEVRGLARGHRHPRRRGVYTIVSLARGSGTAPSLRPLVLVAAGRVWPPPSCCASWPWPTPHRSPRRTTRPSWRSASSPGPPPPDRFAWLKETTHGRMNVFITFLVGGGRHPVRPGMGRRSAGLEDLDTDQRAAPRRPAPQPISYPRGLVVDDVTVLAQDVPGADDAPDPQAVASLGELTVAAIRPGRIMLGARRSRPRGSSGCWRCGRRPCRPTVASIRARGSRSSCKPGAEGGETGQSLQEMVEALLSTCRLEVPGRRRRPDPAGGLRAVPGRPAASARRDESSRQLRGCLEDWTIDSLHVDVVSIGPAVLNRSPAASMRRRNTRSRIAARSALRDRDTHHGERDGSHDVGSPVHAEVHATHRDQHP